MMTSSSKMRLVALLFTGAVTLVSSCTSSVMTHGGVRYSIKPDTRLHRIEKGANGRLMYDSPELTVLVDGGRLVINGTDCGAVAEKDHVEITDLGTVLVNGQRRGDSLTGTHGNVDRKEHVVY